MTLSLPTSFLNWRTASRNGRPSMSPTVPPISTMTTSTPRGHLADRRLDLVGDVRDDLDGAAQVVPAPLLLDDRAVDLAGGDVVVAGHPGRGEALVVAEVEVGLAAVVGDVDLAVLVRTHGPRVHVDVGVHLLQRDPEAARLEQRADRGRGQPLAQGGHDAARHEDEFRSSPHASFPDVEPFFHEFRAPRPSSPHAPVEPASRSMPSAAADPRPARHARARADRRPVSRGRTAAPLRQVPLDPPARPRAAPEPGREQRRPPAPAASSLGHRARAAAAGPRAAARADRASAPASSRAPRLAREREPSRHRSDRGRRLVERAAPAARARAGSTATPAPCAHAAEPLAQARQAACGSRDSRDSTDLSGSPARRRRSKTLPGPRLGRPPARARARAAGPRAPDTSPAAPPPAERRQRRPRPGGGRAAPRSARPGRSAWGPRRRRAGGGPAAAARRTSRWPPSGSSRRPEAIRRRAPRAIALTEKSRRREVLDQARPAPRPAARPAAA